MNCVIYLILDTGQAVLYCIGQCNILLDSVIYYWLIWSYPYGVLSFVHGPIGLNVFPSRRMKLPFPFLSGPSPMVEIRTLPSARQWVV